MGTDRAVGPDITSWSLDAGSVPVEARRGLERDGVVCIRQAFDEQWRGVIETGIADALGGASVDVDIVQRDGDAGRFSFSSGAWQSVEPFRKFIFESALADIALDLVGGDYLGLLYDFLLIKEANSDCATTPWHQDHSYYPVDGTKVVNSWVALDDIPIESALQFRLGSHRPSELYRAVDFDDPDRDYRHARTELRPPPEGDAAPVAATWMEAGDMLVWWSYTVHSAPGNTLPRRRAAFSVNWFGDDVVFNGKPSLDTYRDPSLVVGEPIVCDRFPLVRGTVD